MFFNRLRQDMATNFGELYKDLRARARGCYVGPETRANLDLIRTVAVLEAQEARRLAKEARNRPCGAKTRAGTPCARKSCKNGRCPNHGGMSTGPKTNGGKRRISWAQKQRWARWRAEKAAQAQVT